jgi:hypothetical protein
VGNNRINSHIPEEGMERTWIEFSKVPEEVMERYTLSVLDKSTNKASRRAK